MSEPVFLRHSRGLTLDEIAKLCGVAPSTTPHARRIIGLAPLDRATPSELTFFDHKKYADAAAITHAGACLTTAALAQYVPPHVAVFAVREPYRAFVTVSRELFPHSLRPSSLSRPGEIAGAHVDPAARLEDGVTIDPGAVIGPGVEIGSGTVIGANAVLGAEVRVGRDCSIGAGSAIANTLIGDGVIIHQGCKIGQDGFGYVMGSMGHLKVPQIGRVIIQDNVEIGAGTAVDRGAIRDTVIGEGTKIDNLVQVGHNVSIGRHCVIVAQSGISGSSTLEDFVLLGARVGIDTNVTVGEGAQIAGTSIVHSDVPPGARWGGMPAKPVKIWFREMLIIEQLARRRGGTQAAGDA
ncbi:MAG: UDP-3-O-(3-hydroxymyristoyl)glucosamine N-acyltransferase [Pseudolabrys sp.]